MLKNTECPYIVKFKDSFSGSMKGVNLCCYLFEFLIGGELQSIIKENFALPIESTRIYSAMVLCGLQNLHQN